MYSDVKRQILSLENIVFSEAYRRTKTYPAGAKRKCKEKQEKKGKGNQERKFVYLAVFILSRNYHMPSRSNFLHLRSYLYLAIDVC